MHDPNVYLTILRGCFARLLESVFRYRRSNCHFLAPENGHFYGLGAYLNEPYCTGVGASKEQNKLCLRCKLIHDCLQAVIGGGGMRMRVYMQYMQKYIFAVYTDCTASIYAVYAGTSVPNAKWLREEREWLH